MQHSCSTVQGLKVQSQIRCVRVQAVQPLGSVQNRVQKQSVEVWLDRIREPSHCFGSGRSTSSTTTRRVPTSEAHVRRGHQGYRSVSCRTIGTTGTGETSGTGSSRGTIFGKRLRKSNVT